MNIYTLWLRSALWNGIGLLIAWKMFLSKTKQCAVFQAFIFFCCTHASAQFVDDTLRYAESIWSMQKKAMILNEMDLTEAEKASFWPVYESYSNAIQYLEMEYIRLMNLTDEERGSERKAALFTENMLLNELLLAKARKYYFKKFRKALGPALASRFMQLDSDFRTMIRLQMQKNPTMITSLDRVFLKN